MTSSIKYISVNHWRMIFWPYWSVDSLQILYGSQTFSALIIKWGVLFHVLEYKATPYVLDMIRHLAFSTHTLIWFKENPVWVCCWEEHERKCMCKSVQNCMSLPWCTQHSGDIWSIEEGHVCFNIGMENPPSLWHGLGFMFTLDSNPINSDSGYVGCSPNPAIPWTWLGLPAIY